MISFLYRYHLNKFVTIESVDKKDIRLVPFFTFVIQDQYQN